MKICLLALLILLSAVVFAQIDDNPNNLRAKIFELRVKTIPPATLKLPFHSIKIIDARLDTSKLGFRITNKVFVTVNKVFEKIILKPGIAAGIESFYNEYYKNNFSANGNVLLISLKKLWINSLPDRQAKYERKNIDRSSLQDIYARFEYYLGSANAYIPLKRIDTVFQLTPDAKVADYDPKDENKLPFFCFALEKMVENVNYGFYIKDLEQRRKMTLEEVEKYNTGAKNIPVLNESIKAGVFLNFEEFKNNRPSVTMFSKRKILKKKIYEIADEKGNIITHYFAYFDGEKLAMGKPLTGLFAANISQDNYNIYKVGNSFQFFENHILIRQEDDTYVSNDTYTGTRHSIVWVPRQIDMETGEVY